MTRGPRDQDFGLSAATGLSAAATLEETPEGTRLTLRPAGRGRWGGVAFLCFWLCGWTAGEIAALGTLLGPALITLDPQLFRMLPRFSGGTAGAGGAFLLFWLTFWTLGGAVVWCVMLRLAIGRDVITLGPGEWRVWQGAGPFGKARVLQLAEVRGLRVGGQNNALTAETERGTVPITALGTESDRRWLHERLRSEARIPQVPAAAADSLSVTRPPEAAPAGWVAEDMPDGGVRVMQSRQMQLAGAGCMTVFALFWNVFCWKHVVESFRPGSFPGFGTLFFLPFLAGGVLMAGMALWLWLGREEWITRRGTLEVRRTFLGRVWSKRYEAARLRISSGSDGDGGRTFRLEVMEAGGAPRLLTSNTDPAMIRQLARIIAYHARFPVDGPAGFDG